MPRSINMGQCERDFDESVCFGSGTNCADRKDIGTLCKVTSTAENILSVANGMQHTDRKPFLTDR